MEALLSFILNKLLAFWPIAQVDEWKAAMMVRNGRIHRALGPGLHWRWLFIERVIDWPKTEVILSLATASITTADGKSIAVDANLGYRVVDLSKNFRTMWNLESSVKAMAAGIICSGLALRSWPEMQGAARKEREADILSALNDATSTFGVEVVRVHLVACVEARQHRHFIDGSLAR